MKQTDPPPFAAWILEHWTPGGCDHGLAGDLLESFRAGRSSTWYCRQVVAALVIGWTGSLFRHRIVLIFAAAWATLSPAWSLLILRLDHWNNFIGPVWRLPWPWSTVCVVCLSTAEGLLFIWAGVLVYLIIIPSPLRTTNQWRIGRAFAASFAVYVLAVVCELVTAALIAAPSSKGHGADWRALTVSGVITDFRIWTLFSRLPVLIGTVCALWRSASTGERPVKLVE